MPGSWDFYKLVETFPALQHTKRKGVEFVQFNPKIVGDCCGSSYVIPFVSETECLATRRSNGRWVLPGGTLEPGENWIQAAHREVLEETGAVLKEVTPVGMYRCVSDDESPRLPHIPHPVHVRVVSFADVTRITNPSDPDGDSTITEVRAVHYTDASTLFCVEDLDFAALYQLAFLIRQMTEDQGK